MKTLKPISPEPSPKPRLVPFSTGQASVRKLSRLSLRGISESETRSRPSRLAILKQQPLRILDFDIETVAAGFADPEWVPQKITCIAWSWIGEDDVRAKTCGGPAGLYENQKLRAAMISEFLGQYNQADIVTGHNLIRFDLPVLNAECMRLGLPVLEPKRVQDTMRLPRSKGFKKGLDNLAGLVGTFEEKLSKNWQQWEDSYAEPGWAEIMARARSDVILHKELREQMILRGWTKPTVRWTP